MSHMINLMKTPTIKISKITFKKGVIIQNLKAISTIIINSKNKSSINIHKPTRQSIAKYSNLKMTNKLTLIRQIMLMINLINMASSLIKYREASKINNRFTFTPKKQKQSKRSRKKTRIMQVYRDKVKRNSTPLVVQQQMKG